MKTIYIAGPMRGIPLYNFPAFDEAEAELTRQGWNTISPANLDREIRDDPENTPVTPEFLREVMKRDAQAIIDRADAVALLPGWEKSVGAQAELSLARWKGIDIYLYPEMRIHHRPEEDVLEEALRITRGDRQNQYGPPDQDFRRTARMWAALLETCIVVREDGVGLEITPRMVAMCMIALKLSRETHQRSRDNWVDAAGYARCGSLCGS